MDCLYSYTITILWLLVLYFTSGIKTEYINLKPNILFIIIDDLRCLSGVNVSLPNINNLAANGVNFKNAFAQQALCAPSRNSILTGRRPDTLHLYDFYSYWRDSVSNFSTLPQFMKQNGYDTYSVGKVFHPGASSNFTDDYPYSWSLPPYHPPTDKYKDAAVCKDRKTGEFKRNLICPVTVEKQPGKSLPDLETVKYAGKILKRNHNKPFMMAVGFHKPHIPLKFPKQYLANVPIRDVRPPDFPNKPENMPQVAWHPWTDVRSRDDIKRLNISFPFGLMPPKWTLKIRQSYYSAAIYIDDLIGILMSYVNTRTTIVVLTSDHGWSLGENGLWAKYSNFDVAVKVPLIFSIPGVSPKSIHTPVELIDIFPTLVELTGISKNIPKCTNQFDVSKLCFEGKSLVPFMKEEIDNQSFLSPFIVEPNPYFALSQYPRPSVQTQVNSDKPRLKYIKIMGYSIRTTRYRYTEWISFNNTKFTRNWNKIYGSELYDHIIDTQESNNLYLEPAYTHVKSFLSELLRSCIESTVSYY